MKDDFEFEDENISINDFLKKIIGTHKKKRKRKSKEEREREKEIRIDERECYKSLVRNGYSTLNGLRNEIYTLIYNYDILNFKSNLKTLDEICENEDIDTLEKIIKDSNELIKLYKKSLKEDVEVYEIKDFKTIKNITRKGFKEIKLYQDKQAIIKFIGSNERIILECLECISTVEESDIVYEALIGTEHITLLPKGYAKAKVQKTLTFEHRFQKHLNSVYTFI